LRLIAPIRSLLSFFLQNRIAYFALFAVAAAIKLILSALAPASFELETWQLFGFYASPWVVIEGGLFQLWGILTSSTISLEVWSTTGPWAMQGDLRLLSLLLRLPAFASDVMMAVVLYLAATEFTGKPHLGRLSSLIWFLNPFTLFAAELLAVPDVLVALLTLVSMLYLAREKTLFSSVTLFCAIALKLYPIILLPAILIYMHRYSGMKRRSQLWPIVCAFLGVVAYLSWLLWASRLTVDYFTIYTPVSQPFAVLAYFSSNIPLSVAMGALTVVYLLAWYFGDDSSSTGYLVHLFSVVLLTYFIFSDFFAQYFIWVLPFITLDITLFSRRRFALLAVLLLFLFVTWFLKSGALVTPSGYSLLMIPLEGPGLPSYSIATQRFLQAGLTKFVLLTLSEDAMYAFALVYVLLVVSHWVWRRRARDYETG
jgi:hypothetical protein